MPLKDRVQDALDEARTLVLGTQVLLGFQYQSTFEPGFAKFSQAQQQLSLLSLLLLIENFMLLLVPVAHQIIGDRGNDTPFEYRLASRCVAAALPMFALSIGVDCYLSAIPIAGDAVAAATGTVVAMVALGAWFGIRPSGRASEAEEAPMARQATPLDDRIRRVLTETRVVLPGAQTLLGFACITTLLDGFSALAPTAKAIHLASLIAVAISTILLMTPAAIHRIAEHGKATERFHRLASALVIAALIPLGLSLSGEIFVVVYKVSESTFIACGLAFFAAASFAGGWFVFPAVLRYHYRS